MTKPTNPITERSYNINKRIFKDKDALKAAISILKNKNDKPTT